MKVIRLTLCILAVSISTVSKAQEKGSLDQNADPAFFRSMHTYVKMNERRNIDGYRVQIYNGRRDDASKWRTECMQAFPKMNSMIVFETPDYKVQVGNFRTLFEAEAALDSLRETFPGAFVVATSINPPELVVAKENEEPTVQEVVPSDEDESSKEPPLRATERRTRQERRQNREE